MTREVSWMTSPVYRTEPEKYLLVVNAGNIDKDWDWCVKPR